MKNLARTFGVPALTAVLLLSGAVPGPAQTKVKVRDLPPQHQEWLKLVSYIIKAKEREVFLMLQNDRDRDLFMEEFTDDRCLNKSRAERLLDVWVGPM